MQWLNSSKNCQNSHVRSRAGFLNLFGVALCRLTRRIILLVHYDWKDLLDEIEIGGERTYLHVICYIHSAFHTILMDCKSNSLVAITAGTDQAICLCGELVVVIFMEIGLN